MLLLYETFWGYALLRVVDDAILVDNVHALATHFQSAEAANEAVVLVAFYEFPSQIHAFVELESIKMSLMSPALRGFLLAHCQVVGETLGVGDPDLGDRISSDLPIPCLHNIAVHELLRGVRSQSSALVGDPPRMARDRALSHRLARQAMGIGLEPDMVDAFIRTTVGLYDALVKELNTYTMRLREWYGPHFPELSSIVQPQIPYVKSVLLMGDKLNAANLDFSEFLSLDDELSLKAAAVHSHAPPFSQLEMLLIQNFCRDVVLPLHTTTTALLDSLNDHMQAFAPNLTALVGVPIAPRLIYLGGGLSKLSKMPASTLETLGANEATPRDGLIYRSPLVDLAPEPYKRKFSRTLAAKCALAIRIDVFGAGQDNAMGLQYRDLHLQTRLDRLRQAYNRRYLGLPA
ncbi:probable nucleolar protein 5-2 [Arabidopsis lyrata subsp. lyrata]|uniref:probable nucleolar protein 5-2 n=1 Tax=Arabidopsis lyrata subsp. lyrata TaxID=81972 RepID=UPI000A29B526|nr:probable nucleolar protein 5-2 [Arabidopsis lyrata subsp. lyrata]|eukprot:XP_020873038.1 probable nucleolar protein 5-2 [Arabidopsis lyrata subsp. lyrata]